MAQKIRTKIGILGYGREGRSVLKFLRRDPRYKSSEFWIVAKKAPIEIPRGVRRRLGKNYLKNLTDFDVVFRSPGIPFNLPELRKTRRAGVEFSSATKLFFDHCPAKIIGITGTKGKGTTATLLYKIFKTVRKNVFLAGNIGKPALDLLPRLSAHAPSAIEGPSPRKPAVVILELSSFQLQDLTKSPQIAVMLDIFPDHQDAHFNLREYYEAKTNIARRQKYGDTIFFFKNHPLCRSTAAKSRGRKIAVDPDNFRLFKPTDLKMPGEHNFKNAVMAATIAKSLGVPEKTILKVVKNFRGLEHRLELVRTIRYSNILKNMRMDFYNDSASTNPQTTAAAIKAFPNQPKILIAGGQDKGLDYAPLARALKNSNTKLVVIFGENKKKIQRQIAKSKVPVIISNTLEFAVKTAHDFAKKLATRHSLLATVIIFSPGSASFDQFKDYADRGKRFKKIVRAV